LPANWIIDGHLQIGRKVEDGSTVKCNSALISVGDFVDVGVEIDVATGNKNGENRVHLSVTHIVQLLKAAEASKVNPRPLTSFLK